MVAVGIAAIVVILLGAAVFLFVNLPDANAFNAKVEQHLRGERRSDAPGPRSSCWRSWRSRAPRFPRCWKATASVIFVLLVFSTALLMAALVFLVTIITLNRRISAIQRSGIQVSSLMIARESRSVYINDMEFALTEAAMETLSVLAEARMDDEVLTGAQIEAVISGRNEADCDEAAGATRVKRLRDALGNQLVSELLVKTIARRGYVLAVGKDVIRDDLKWLFGLRSG